MPSSLENLTPGGADATFRWLLHLGAPGEDVAGTLQLQAGDGTPFKAFLTGAAGTLLLEDSLILRKAGDDHSAKAVILSPGSPSAVRTLTAPDESGVIAIRGAALAEALRTLANPSAVRYFRANADNTVSLLTAAQLAADLAPQLGVPRVLYSSAVKVSRPTGNTNLWTPLSWTLPANSLGPNGWLDVHLTYSQLNSGTSGTRLWILKLGGQTIKQQGTIVSQNAITAMSLRMWNRNSNTIHVLNNRRDRADWYWTSVAGLDANGDDGDLLVGGAVDTAQDQALELTFQPVHNDDKAYLQAVTVSAYYKA